MKQTPVKTCLVCGFLGAGKTTFIKDRLKYSRERTAVLVNEFGTLGMDGDDITESGTLKVIEMPGGCVCCSQSENLVDAVMSILRQNRPERILIEPSGVAEASAVIKTLTQGLCPRYIKLESVITIVDAANFLEDIHPDAFGGFFMDQLINADTILINKIDLVTFEIVEKIKSSISKINESALILPVNFCSPDLIPTEAPRPALKESGFPPKRFDFISMKPSSPLGHAQLKTFGDKLKAGEFGKILRVKAILRSADGKKLTLNYARGELSIEESLSSLCERLTLIGLSIHRKNLENFFADPSVP